jgi:GDP-L-fucose synthase
VNLTDKIYVAGHKGLVGSAILKGLRQLGYSNLIFRTHGELDLTDRNAVEDFFSRERPQYVFLAAAKVGGILANYSYPADFIFENLSIETNVIHECWRSGVDRLLFLGSSCIYPKLAPQPIKEEALLGGPLEFTNRPYAVAKIAGIEMCWAYNRQHGARFLAAMPTNLYGPGDNYDSKNSHLIPALIRRVYEAKLARAKQVVVWGTGAPRREFLYSEDAADACIFLMRLLPKHFDELVRDQDNPPLINIGSGVDLAVREIAELVSEVLGSECPLVFDPTKPDGTPRKLLDTTRLTALGWKPRIGLREGLSRTCQDFCSTVAMTSLAISTGQEN